MLCSVVWRSISMDDKMELLKHNNNNERKKKTRKSQNVYKINKGSTDKHYEEPSTRQTNAEAHFISSDR